MTQTKDFRSLEERITQMPYIQVMRGIWQNDFHEFDVFDHTMDYVRHIKSLTDDPEIIIAGYLHDIGKPVTATPKYKDGKLLERSPGQTYHEFTDHEKVGEEMVRNMESTIFSEQGLSQDRIARLVGCHYIPMKGIKELRKTADFDQFRDCFYSLATQLESLNVTKEEVLTMFLADKLAQEKYCTDRDELFAIRKTLINSNETEIKSIYEMQKRAYGGKE